MKIERVIDGKLVEIVLTSRELNDVFSEQEYRYTEQDILDYLEHMETYEEFRTYSVDYIEYAKLHLESIASAYIDIVSGNRSVEDIEEALEVCLHGDYAEFQTLSELEQLCLLELRRAAALDEQKEAEQLLVLAKEQREATTNFKANMSLF